MIRAHQHPDFQRFVGTATHEATQGIQDWAAAKDRTESGWHLWCLFRLRGHG
jgi:hypothetical protein